MFFFLKSLKCISQAIPLGVSKVDSDDTVIPEGSSRESSDMSSSSSVVFLLENLSNVLFEEEVCVLALSDEVQPVLAGDEDEDEEDIDVEPGFSIWQTSLCFSTEACSRLGLVLRPPAGGPSLGPGYIVTGCSFNIGSKKRNTFCKAMNVLRIINPTNLIA